MRCDHNSSEYLNSLPGITSHHHIISGHVTFYERNVTDIGQKPLNSSDDIYDAYSLYGKRLVGSCGFSLKYNQGAYPFNWTHVAEPSYHPTYRPSAAPTLTSAPSHTPTLPPSSTPTEVMPFTGNFSCLESCEFYPGIPQSGSLLGLCDFFSQDTFYLCSTFSMLHGLCTVPKCLSSCTVQDYCYFAVNTAANCPRGMYVCTRIDMNPLYRLLHHLQLSCRILHATYTHVITCKLLMSSKSETHRNNGICII